MAKSYEVKRLDSLPMPRVVREATTSIPAGFGYVSHSSHFLSEKTRQKTARGGKKTVEKFMSPTVETRIDHYQDYLTSANHAFYIGKFFPKSWKRRLYDVLGWSPAGSASDSDEASSGDGQRDHIYNEELIEAAISHLFAHLDFGEKAQVIVGPCLSELINGRQDLEGALSASAEADLIRKIAKKLAINDYHGLEVLEMDKMPLHAALFAALRREQDPATGKANVEAVLSEVAGPITTESSSLEIAAVLYRATQESSDLALHLRKTIPGKLRNNAEDEQVRNAQNYGMLEIAIRIRDILSGRYIHAGAERQACYDDIIVEIIKGSQGRFVNVEALQDLFKVTEGVRFETLHIDNKINPPMLRSIRLRARSKIAMLGLLGASLVGGGVRVGEWRNEAEQSQRQALVDQALAQDLANERFTFDGRWPVPKSSNVLHFHYASQAVRSQISFRYGLNAQQLDSLKPFVDDYLLNRHLSISSIDSEVPLQIQAADDFMIKKSKILLTLGIVPKRPYQNLESYLPLFDKLPVENYSQMDAATDWVGNIPVKRTNHYLRSLGFFRTGLKFRQSDEYEIVVFTNEQGEHILAAKNARTKVGDDMTSPDSYYRSEKAITYDSATAREMACQYMKEMKLYRANQFYQYRTLIDDALAVPDYRGIPEDIEVPVDAIASTKRLGHYVTFPDNLDFELAVYEYTPDPRDFTRVRTDVLLARHSPDQPFTRQVAREAAWYWTEALKLRGEDGNFCDNSESSSTVQSPDATQR